MTPASKLKKGVGYRYYMSTALLHPPRWLIAFAKFAIRMLRGSNVEGIRQNRNAAMSSGTIRHGGHGFAFGKNFRLAG